MVGEIKSPENAGPTIKVAYPTKHDSKENKWLRIAKERAQAKD